MPLRAWARSRGIPATLALWAGTVLLAVMFGDTTLGLPLVNRPVPTRALLVVVIALLVLPPLQDRFPELVRTLPRRRVDRGFAVVLVLVLGYSLCVLTSTAATLPLPLALLILASSVFWAITLGEIAWMASFSMALTIIIVEYGQSPVLSRTAQHLGVPAASGVLVLLAVTFVIFGPGNVTNGPRT